MEKTFKITASEGLHARPATLLVSAVNPLDAEVRLVHNGKPANLKSIMAVMAAGIPSGAEVTITAEGADAEQAIEKVSEVFVSQNLGEEI
ncbi:HPr family phosphocarrier protein [Edaphobacillus lindanitolerans]|uniref:Phosphocarrier protein HPr n=1 Tax=Edaphobacillus lindanitolerans TaxID=550447 RepID=A0A1U7PRD5_9BACI|nr:HPr family phosphocarrier protein [Edaphobacillus lindanitolerans]SIT87937.1 phosphocarrier protein [Edaphobacillus lindanitolerans]